MRLGKAQKLIPFCRDQLFIGGDHAFARCKQGRNKFKRGVKPAHGLDDDLHVIVVQNHVKILNKLIGIRIAGKIPQIQNIFQFQRILRTAFDNAFMVLVENLDHARADSTVTHHGHIHALTSYYIDTDSILAQFPRGIKKNFSVSVREL